MKIKDIVNREIANLKNCDHEPIHIPGSIQPHGFLLALNSETSEIRFCSENSILFTGLTHAQLLGKNAIDIFGKSCTDNLAELKLLAEGQPKIFKVQFSGKELEFVAHSNKDTIILESEEPFGDIEKENDLFALSKQFLGYMEDSHSLVELCALVADGVQKATDYDRVMIYRFDKDYNGEVVAESKRDDLESFLGLHYPHTDIPAQARELYIKNLLRIIVDVNYKPVPLYTIDDGNSENLDLSHSVLRSVSPIHIQYLQNMGVGATLTISLIYKQKLWGLIACHHYSAKYLTHQVRLAAKLQGHFITSQIEVREMNEEYKTSKQAHDAADELISRSFELERNSLSSIIADPNLLRLCKATGVSMIVDDKIYKQGFTPSDNDINQLSAYLASHTRHSALHTDSIIKNLPALQNIAQNTPGINYYPLDKFSKNCIVWYKSETISQVNWAGDPNKSIEKDKNGLSPRKSFDLWSQKVKHHSNPWLKAELTASSNFVNFMQKHLSAILLAEEEEKQRDASEKLKEINSELENINWISTHDLQEPLRKIQVITSFILSEEENKLSEEVQGNINRINKSANKMQSLITDILKYTNLKESADLFVKVNLNELISETLREMDEALKDKKTIIKMDELPVIRGVSFLLKQLFSNLIYNSLKFASPGRIPELIISTFDYHEKPSKIGLSNEYYVIKISDNGIGFDPEYNDKIFKIFTRLNVASEFPGSGIGLALCKKIMDKHDGIIKAEGARNVGAAFLLYFPK